MKPPKDIFQSLLSKVQSSLASEEEATGADDEVTQKSRLSEMALPTLSGLDLESMVASLDSIVFKALMPKLEGRRVLYVFAGTTPYLPLIAAKTPAAVVCTGPQLPATPVELASVPGAVVRCHYGDSCFRKQSFDMMVVPEAICKGMAFMARIHYWAALLKKGGEVVVSFAHPQSRFLRATREERHRSSRTATMERIFERCREVGLEIVALRELLVSHVPATALKTHAAWRDLKSQYEEWPILLGLHLRKS